jgi:aminoglycoside phosphotransferase
MTLLDKSTAIQNLKIQHQGTESLAIKNTFIRRISTLIALKTTAHLFKRNGACIPISKNLIVKTGPYVHLAEAATMRFVADSTSLPVPKVFCSFLHKDHAYIVMERIQGECIPTAWKHNSEVSREKIFDQLKILFQELRELKPVDGTSVESCVGGTVREARIPRPLPRMGPFKTIQEFHLFLRDSLRPDEATPKEDDEEWQDIIEMATKQDGPWPATVFTHGDLNPFNILVRGDEVAAIIDWECAGWFPNYWEYTSAWYSNLTRAEWQENLDKFLDTFPGELEMERVRNKWWGEW